MSSCFVAAMELAEAKQELGVLRRKLEEVVGQDGVTEGVGRLQVTIQHPSDALTTKTCHFIY